jgi:hypothetical protein
MSLLPCFPVNVEDVDELTTTVGSVQVPIEDTERVPKQDKVTR